MSSKLWTDADIQKLKDLIDKNYTKTQIADELNRSITAIQVKVNRLGLAIYNTEDNKGSRGRNWKESDIEEFTELWNDPTISMNVMCSRLHRSRFSLRKKALELNLGSRDYDTEYLSVPTICEEMQVSHDRVSNWLKIGLPYKKSRSGKTNYLIDVDDLLKFLECHQDMFDASKISRYIFAEEPDWLIAKRKADAKYYPTKLRSEYTNEDDKTIQRMFYRGCTDKEIAEAIGRTPTAVSGRRRILNLMKDTWSDYEIEILQQNSRYKTVDELLKMLPRRTKKSIEWMCRKHNLPYHFSKEKCEKHIKSVIVDENQSLYKL